MKLTGLDATRYLIDTEPIEHLRQRKTAYEIILAREFEGPRRELFKQLLARVEERLKNG